MGKVAQFLESHGPKISCLGLASIAYYNGWLEQAPNQFSTLLQATINVAAIAVGFLAAAKGILISSDGKDIIKRLRSTNQFLPLINYFIAATLWSIILCAYSAFLLVVDSTVVCLTTQILLIAWVSILTGACFACFRVIYLFNSILRTLSK